MLKPGPDQEAFVENQSDERAHLPWAHVVLDSGHNLSSRGVSKVEVVQEGLHVGLVIRFANVGVAPLGGVPIERGIAQGWDCLLVPFTRVPRQISNEAFFENPIEKRRLTLSGRLSGYFESGLGPLLRENSDWVEFGCEDSCGLVRRRLDAAFMRDPLKFKD